MVIGDLDAAHSNIIEQILTRPSGSNLEWRRVRSLLDDVSIVTEQHNSRLRATLGGETTLHETIRRRLELIRGKPSVRAPVVRGEPMAKAAKLTRGLHWKDDPEEHDFRAASAYLNLLFDDSDTAVIVKRLRSRRESTHKAKDLLRASRLELLLETDPEVLKDLTKVARREKLSPVLLVRVGAATPLIVADGYHRICAGYHLDEDAAIPCRLVDCR